MEMRKGLLLASAVVLSLQAGVARAETAARVTTNPHRVMIGSVQIAANNDEATRVHDRLVTLRKQMENSYKAADKAELTRLNEAFSNIAKNKDYDIQCRLVATGSMRQIKYYIKALDEKDADMKKIALAGVSLAEISTKRNLQSCT